jgi:hypothetical protein
VRPGRGPTSSASSLLRAHDADPVSLDLAHPASSCREQAGPRREIQAVSRLKPSRSLAAPRTLSKRWDIRARPRVPDSRLPVAAAHSILPSSPGE